MDASRRMTLLLETLRIVRSNLPFRFGESDESELVTDLEAKEAFRATINRQAVTQAIVEQYDSTHIYAVTYLSTNRLLWVPSFAMSGGLLEL
ncbi:hypothetical protein PPTG_22466 [Phytophthora nicotianae INRA-310]|uniref:Uncharacterized protein n=1 Tax=Phytophthora nicotianae (strain INRA-310) TaxID=761204 RepID=W2QH68_PHYN3|nr:hypothetical protein PPTG_22466 [Phytophthora nicotianae INRA-310]ETN12206.1 hypothetical protein PPTG_22466 [Phytophthora nicotianae INRA-310]